MSLSGREGGVEANLANGIGMEFFCLDSRLLCLADRHSMAVLFWDLNFANSLADVEDS